MMDYQNIINQKYSSHILLNGLITSFFLLGIFIFPYDFIIGSALLFISASLDIMITIPNINQKNYFNKKQLILPTAILITIFSIKFSAFFSNSLIPENNFKINKTLESLNIWTLFLFFIITISPKIQYYKKQITLTLIFSIIPIAIASLFLSNIYWGIFFGNRNIYAVYLAVIGLLAFNYLITIKLPVLQRYILMIFCSMTTFLLYKLNCRNAALSVTIALFMQLILLKNNLDTFKKFKKHILISFILLALITLIMLTTKYWTEKITGSMLDFSTNERLAMWLYSIRHIPENLWFGHGWGTFIDHFNHAHILKQKMNTHNHHYLFICTLFRRNICIFKLCEHLCYSPKKY